MELIETKIERIITTDNRVIYGFTTDITIGTFLL